MKQPYHDTDVNRTPPKDGRTRTRARRNIKEPPNPPTPPVEACQYHGCGGDIRHVTRNGERVWRCYRCGRDPTDAPENPRRWDAP